MKKGKLSKEYMGYFFIAPFFIVFIIFGLYPVLYTLGISFTSWDGFSDPLLIGFDNYKRILTDAIFWKSVLNTIIMTVVAGVLQLTFGLVIAYILNQRFIKGPNLLKSIYYFPNLVTAVSLGVLFSMLFDWQGGSINGFLTSLGLIEEPINWMINGTFAKGLIIFILWFQYFGYYIIIFTAGIKGVSAEVLEAAMIDGATAFQTFIRIVLPLLKPVITYASITVLIGGMQLFDVPYTIGNTVGEPGGAVMTAVNYMYNTSFRNYNYGYGATISYTLFLLIIIFSIVYINMTVKREDR